MPHDLELEAITRALKRYRWDRQYKKKGNEVSLHSIAHFIGCSHAMLYQLTNGRWSKWAEYPCKPSSAYKARLRYVIDLIEQNGMRFVGGWRFIPGKAVMPDGREARFPISMRPPKRRPYPKKWQGPVRFEYAKVNKRKKRKHLKRGPKPSIEHLCPVCSLTYASIVAASTSSTRGAITPRASDAAAFECSGSPSP